MTEKEIAAIFERQVDTVYRACYAFMGNSADAQDAAQETFIRMMRANPEFESSEHEKAWLIRVASNCCKDLLKRASRRDVPLESADEPADPDSGGDETLRAVIRLEPKHRDAIYLHYYEGYSTEEIGEMLGRPPSTIRNHLSEARKILERQLGGEAT